MKKLLLLLCVLCAAQPELRAQGGRGYLYQEWTVEQGDSTPLIHVAPVPVFQRPADLRRYRRLVDAVKKVYPIAKTARAKMAEMEAELLRLPTKKEQKAYIKQVSEGFTAALMAVISSIIASSTAKRPAVSTITALWPFCRACLMAFCAISTGFLLPSSV